MHMQRNQLLGITLGWAVTIAVILAAPLIAIDVADRSPFFWYRVLWTAFLATMMWASGGALIMGAADRDVDRQQTAGLLPAVGLVVISYAAASFIVMLLFMLVADGNSPSKANLVVQVILAGTAGVFCAFLSLARSSSSSGLATFPPGIPAPTVLATHIEEQEQRCKSMGTDAAQIAAELKQLRETIEYSLSRVGSIASSDNYKGFATKVLDFCADLSTADSGSADGMSTRTDLIRALQREAKSIANTLKR